MSERVKQSIPLGGINTALPTSIVTDGALKDAMNVRHKNGALQNVCAPMVIHPITTSNDYQIIHRMDTLPQNEYIATKTDEIGTINVDHVAIVRGVVTKIGRICQLRIIAQNIKFHNFGNVLYVNYERTVPFEGQVYSEITFIYKNNVFREIDITNINPPVIETIEIETKNANSDIVKTPISGGTKEFLYAEKHQKVKDEGFIIGGFYVALAYKMTDGTLIKASSPVLFCSTVGNIGKEIKVLAPGFDHYLVYYTTSMNAIKVKILLSELVNNADELIQSITVLTSRIRTGHEIDKIVEKYKEASGGLPVPSGTTYPSTWLIDKEAVKFNEPMYELCDVDFRTTREVVIDYDKIKDVIHNPVYTPSFSHHAMIGRGKLEYNNRLHYYDIQTKFYENIYPTPISYTYKGIGSHSDHEEQYEQTSTKISGVVEYTIEVENKTININHPFNEYAYKKADAADLFIRMPNIVCYPDARATKINLYIKDTANVVRVNSLQLEKVLSQNMSIGRLSKLTGTEDLINYNTYINVTSGVIHDGALPTKSGSLYEKQTNHLHVSAINNPFFVAVQNIYSIGEVGSKIEAINTATEQISETRFGAYPIYIFSDRAIHAMETGTDNAIYASIIGISNERKLHNTTTVGAANAVMFIGDKGVMALEGRYAVCLSNDISDAVDTDLELVAFETYYRRAQLLYNSKENELIVYNDMFDYAYIYSLYSKVWTRRSWSGTQIGSRQIATTNGVCSLLDEDRSKPIANVQIVTRPLRLGAMELKRVETVLARISVGLGSIYSITLEGSNDAMVWQQLNKVTDHHLIRRTPSSAVYHRLLIWANVKDHLSITHFDVECYLRFARRMR